MSPRKSSGRALPDGRRLGAHLPLGGGMVAAVDRAYEIGARALQVFADNPTAWRRRTEPPTELPKFRRRIAELDIGPIAIHAAYLINLAGPEDDFRERSVAVLTEELRVAPSFGARYVNVHTGSHKLTGLEAGIDRVGEGVARALADSPDGPDAAMLVLENSAGGGGGVGTTAEELEAVLEAATRHGADPARVGLCLDTAHLWGAGHRISDAEGVDALVDELDRRVGIGRVVMMHLNDSKSALGSRLDRHEHLGAGEIGAVGIQRWLTHPRLAHVTYYLETPGMDVGYDKINVRRAYTIAAGMPLPRLPRGALDVRGSRSRSGPATEPA
ncbi:MAG TPA: deoxyribonuclease IV [Candidatus Limnocylindrales bacterium]